MSYSCPRSFDSSGSPQQSSASAPSLRSPHAIFTPSRRPNETLTGGNVKVVVRVRAFLPRELDKGTECLVQMEPSTEETILRSSLPQQDQASFRSSSRKVIEDKSFTFDKSFWSHSLLDSHYAHQEDVYNSLGEEFLDHNFEGYNTCIFAYGQTGSGKSYTMMGSEEQPGLIPRTCEDLFERIENDESSSRTCTVRVSYFEVYNEHVRDLLVPRTNPPSYLKIRESAAEGPYVKDLTEQNVKSYEDITRLMRMGDINRTVASTKMNDTSSRSHAIFTITLKQIYADTMSDETTERTARIRLVDLAGSERAKSTEATGARLREGSNINKSLTTLGRVIATLASNSQRPGTPGTPRSRKVRGKEASQLPPYRDSILTWLLKDSLGGNSKTAMIACIAPADYEETLSTLRYADQAKRIRTRAVINQDCLSGAERDAQIFAMEETIKSLQLSISQQQTVKKREDDAQSQQLEQYQREVGKMQDLMQNERTANETKIKALVLENEALRAHLNLCLESLRKPVIIPEFRKKPRFSMISTEDVTPEAPRAITPEREQPQTPTSRDRTSRVSMFSVADDKVAEWDDGSETDVDFAEMDQVEEDMQALLEDVQLFKRKLDDDHSRFLKPLQQVV